MCTNKTSFHVFIGRRRRGGVNINIDGTKQYTIYYFSTPVPTITIIIYYCRKLATPSTVYFNRLLPHLHKIIVRLRSIIPTHLLL